jgi:hypothetical protein
VEFAQLIQHSYRSQVFTKVEESLLKQENKQIIPQDSLPNIYFILTDAYANSNSLKEYWNYDNQSFLDSMNHHNYYNIKNARANYFYTRRALSAMLNGKYLTTELANLPFVYCNEIINNAIFIQLLQKNNYTIKNYSPFTLGDELREETLTTFPMRGKIVSIYLYYFNKTIFRGFINFFNGNSKQLRQKNLLQNIANFKNSVIQSKQPNLAYLHLFITHDPFLFTDKGELRKSPDSLEIKGKEQELYLEQVKYANTVILDLVKHIEKNSNRPYIVLITGDHGSRLLKGKDAMKESYLTTTHFYFPDKNYESLYDTMSSVNLFRAVMNKAFNKKTAYLPDTIVSLPDSQLK